MGIAAYNRGTRAISRHIDEQLKHARQVNWSAPELWVDQRERDRFQEMGNRRLASVQARDWEQAWIEQRAFNEAVSCEPEDFRRIARRIFMKEAQP